MSLTYPEDVEGTKFSTYANQPVTKIGDRSIIAFRTQNSNVECRVFVTGICTEPGYAYILQDPTITTPAGIQNKIVNRRLGCIKTSTVSDLNGAEGTCTFLDLIESTKISGGAEISKMPIGGGNGGAPVVAGGKGGMSPFLLAPGKVYAFVLESVVNIPHLHWGRVEWREIFR